MMLSPQYEKLKHQLLNESHTWLITGVAGFIGSNLLSELLQLNQKVIGLDNFRTGSKKNLETVLSLLPTTQQNNFHFYEGDIASLDQCQNVVKNVEYILHQAALSSVPGSIQNPTLTHQTNVTGFLNLLLAAKEKKVRRVIYASSSAVYGDVKNLPLTEAALCQPLSPYAASKYANEIYAKVFSSCYNIETIGLRYFNVFGPNQDPNGDYAAVIPRWMIALSRGEPVCIYGDGKTTRDFCYVKDVVQANLLAAMTNHPQALNTVYNIGVGQETSLNELFEIIRGQFKENQQQPIYQDFRAADIRRSVADIGKAKELLGYRPVYTVEKGLNEIT